MSYSSFVVNLYTVLVLVPLPFLVSFHFISPRYSASTEQSLNTYIFLSMLLYSPLDRSGPCKILVFGGNSVLKYSVIYAELICFPLSSQTWYLWSPSAVIAIFLHSYTSSAMLTPPLVLAHFWGLETVESLSDTRRVKYFLYWSIGHIPPAGNLHNSRGCKAETA